jgi:hypothetical protein
MKFEKRKFSKRFPEIEAAIFVIHEGPHTPERYGPTSEFNATPYRGTAAAIILPDGRFWIGVCLCSPLDAFVKATGRAKAIGRAYQKRNHFADGAIRITDEALTMKLEIGKLKAVLERAIDEAKKRVGIL